MDRCERIYKIESLLRSRRVVTFQELQKELQVSPATLKRDLEFLRERMGVPIPYNRARNGYCLDETAEGRHELPGLWFNGQEAYALLAFYQLLERLQPSLLRSHIEPLQARLRALIEEKSQHTVEALRERIRVLPLANRAVDSHWFQVIAQATLARQRLDIRYYNRGRDEETQREISPQRLVHYRDNWYLDAWDHGKAALRTFALDCVRNAELSDAPAQDIAADALDVELGSGYGIFAGRDTQWATLRFTPARARWVAREQWHPRQKSRYDDRGYYLLDVPFTDPRELTMDILKYGADVEVLAPIALRVHVATQLKNAAAPYGKDEHAVND